MPVQFVCPNCTQLLSVGTRKIGTAVSCPRCRQTVRVPDPETAAASVAMRHSQRAPQADSPLPEFVVYDETPVAEFEPLSTVTDPRPFSESPPPPPAPQASGASAVRRTSGQAELWQSLPGGRDREPMLLVSRRALYLQAGILAVTTLFAFGMGYLIGYGVAPASLEVTTPQAGEATVVQGFVRYTDGAGAVVPDAGAVVIALPDGRLPAPKLGVQGLRPVDPQPVPGGGVLMSLELLGGATSRVGADGSYQLAIGEPGRYFLLFISRNAQRTAGSQPDEFQLALMQRYFQPADELIGMQKYLWRVEDLPAGANSRSHDFGASGVE